MKNITIIGMSVFILSHIAVFADEPVAARDEAAIEQEIKEKEAEIAHTLKLASQMAKASMKANPVTENREAEISAKRSELAAKKADLEIAQLTQLQKALILDRRLFAINVQASYLNLAGQAGTSAVHSADASASSTKPADASDPKELLKKSDATEGF